MKRPKGFPRSVDIAGYKVSIEYVDGSILHNGGECDGVAYYAERRVAISLDQPHDQMWETLIHELGHMLIYLSSIYQTSLTKDQNEMIVDQFSRFIHRNFTLRKPKRCRK